MSVTILKGRKIVKGKVEGEALVTKDCISFMGSTNPKTGEIIERGHELDMLYDAVKRGVGPIGMINIEPESIAVIGAIVSELPLVAGIDISQIHTGDHIVLDADNGIVEIHRKDEK